MTDRSYAERQALLQRLADQLGRQIGERVERGWLHYDEVLRSWVYPLRSVWTKGEEKGVWIERCIRVHIYDTRRRCWYGSEIKETLDRYTRRSIEQHELGADSGPLGENCHAQADSEALDTGPERWSDLLWR